MNEHIKQRISAGSVNTNVQKRNPFSQLVLSVKGLN